MRPLGANSKTTEYSRPMTNWRDTLIGKESTIHDAIRAIDTEIYHIGLVVDDDLQLIGTEQS